MYLVTRNKVMVSIYHYSNCCVMAGGVLNNEGDADPPGTLRPRGLVGPNKIINNTDRKTLGLTYSGKGISLSRFV
jgi:hypothetical protein